MSGYEPIAVPMLIAGLQTYQHLQSWIVPNMQAKYLLIIWTPSIFALAGLRICMAPTHEQFIEVGVIMFETLALLAFYLIIIDYVGGTTKLAHALTDRGATLSIVPFCYCPVASHQEQLDWWTRGVYQMLIMPLWQLICASLIGVKDAGSSHYWFARWLLHAMNFVHIGIAMTSILSIYLILAEEERNGLSVITKFVTLKAVVWAHQVASFSVFILKALGFLDGVHSARVMGFITLIQAQFLAVLFFYAYSSNDPAIKIAAGSLQYQELASSSEEALLLFRISLT